MSNIETPAAQGVISRDEWARRYAARVIEQTGGAERWAMEVARIGADEYERNERAAGCAVVWWGGPSGSYNTPEDEADEEMSYWDDDEGTTS